MRILRPLVLPLAAALAGCLSGCHKSQPPPPSIDGLTQALQKTAEKTLVVPSLANEQVVLTVKPADTDAEAAMVLKAASDAGGAGLRSVDAQGRVSILATIPDNNADAFKAALHNVKVTMNKPSTQPNLIEILIENASASPSP